MRKPVLFAMVLLLPSLVLLVIVQPEKVQGGILLESVDVGIDHFEITQGLQNKENDISLVQGKPTVIRIFPRVMQGNAVVQNVTATLHAYRNGAELSDSPIPPDNGPISVDNQAADRSKVEDSLNFTLNPDWYSAKTEFVAKLVLPDNIQDSALANNRYPTTGKDSREFHERNGFSIRYVMIHYNNEGWTGNPRPRLRVAAQRACDYLRSIYPVDPTLLTYDPWEPIEIEFSEGDDEGNLDSAALITELNTLIQAHPSPPDHLYAWTPEDAYPSNGRSDPRWNGGLGLVSFGNDTGGNPPSFKSRWRRTFAHEIGHNTDENGLEHLSHTLQDGEFGFDVMHIDSFGRQVMKHYPTGDPAGNLVLCDFMKPAEFECHAWITPFHYKRLFNFLEPEEADNGEDSNCDDDERAETPENMLVIRGAVTPDGKGKFYPFYLIPTRKEALAQTKKLIKDGEYQVRFYRDDQEVKGARITWTPRFTCGKPARDIAKGEFSTCPFTFFIKPMKNITKVVLQRKEKILATHQVAKMAPQIKNLETKKLSSTNDDPRDRSIRVKWKNPEVTDNAPKLTHQIFWSNDDGKTWRLVSTGLTKKLSIVKAGRLPGGEKCKIQVRSTDGFNVTKETSESFEWKSCPAQAMIIAPRSKAEYTEKAAVLLLGRGFSFVTECKVESKKLIWTSDKQGKLGIGEKLLVRNLQPGIHKITLKVENTPKPTHATITVKINKKE